MVLAVGAVFDAIPWATVGKASAIFLVVSFIEGYFRGGGYLRFLRQRSEAQSVTASHQPNPLEELALSADAHLCEAEAAFDAENLRAAVDAYPLFSESLSTLSSRGWNAQTVFTFLSTHGKARSFRDGDYYEPLRSAVKQFCG